MNERACVRTSHNHAPKYRRCQIVTVKWRIFLTTILSEAITSTSLSGVLSLQTDAENEHDACAEGTIKDSTVVGHIQK